MLLSKTNSLLWLFFSSVPRVVLIVELQCTCITGISYRELPLYIYNIWLTINVQIYFNQICCEAQPVLALFSFFLLHLCFHNNCDITNCLYLFLWNKAVKKPSYIVYLVFTRYKCSVIHKYLSELFNACILLYTTILVK